MRSIELKLERVLIEMSLRLFESFERVWECGDGRTEHYILRKFWIR